MADAYFSSELEPDSELYELKSIEDVMKLFGVSRERAEAMLARGRGDSKGCCIDSQGDSSKKTSE